MKKQKSIQKVLAVTALSLSILSLSSCGNSAEKHTSGTATNSNNQSKTTMDSHTSNSSSAASSAVKGETVTLNVMGKDITYNKVPEKAIAVGYDNAEIMAALDLQDHITGLTGCMNRPEHCYPDLYEKLKNIEILPDGKGKGVPSFETVLSSASDFVYCLSYHLTPDYIAPEKDFSDNKINYYITSGTYGDKHDMNAVYDDIRNIGKIFHAEDKAEKLVSEYKAKVDSITEKVKDKKPKDVFIFDFQDKAGIMTPGGNAFQSSLVKLAGARNVFEDFTSDFDVATIEQIIQRNPEYIILVEYWDKDETQKKIEYLESLPELADVTAIKNKNYIGITGIEYFPSLHNIDCIEKIAKAVHPEVFK